MYIHAHSTLGQKYLRIRLDSRSSLLLKWTTLTAQKWMHMFIDGRGSFTRDAYIISPTSHPMSVNNLCILVNLKQSNAQRAATGPGPTQLIQSWLLWLFCCFSTQKLVSTSRLYSLFTATWPVFSPENCLRGVHNEIHNVKQPSEALLSQVFQVVTNVIKEQRGTLEAQRVQCPWVEA